MLTEFLFARIAEDEKRAREIHAENCETPADVVPDSMGRPMAPTCDCDWHVARVLADCEAKRWIVQAAMFSGQGNEGLIYRHTMQGVLRNLALPYADHPDYREEWKP